MKRILIFAVPLILLASCKEECFSCQDVPGYPNATICKDTYETTMTEFSPTWAEYQLEAVNEGCERQ